MIKNMTHIYTEFGKTLKFNFNVILFLMKEIYVLLSIKPTLKIKNKLHIFFTNSSNLIQVFIIFNYIYFYISIYIILFSWLIYGEGYLLMDDPSSVNPRPISNHDNNFPNSDGPNNENNSPNSHKTNSLKKTEDENIEDKNLNADKGKNKRILEDSSEEDIEKHSKKVKFKDTDSELTFNPKSPISRTSSPISVTSSMAPSEIEKEMAVNPFYKLYYQEEIMKRFGKGAPIREEALRSLTINAMSGGEIPASESKAVLKDHLPGIVWELRKLAENTSDIVLSEAAKSLGKKFEEENIREELLARASEESPNK